jgi:acyl-coenzyme A synthetase/AMP-(fatty) acid ligase
MHSVAPAEINGILLKYPGVKTGSVIGLMFPDGGSKVARAYRSAAAYLPSRQRIT